jgi:hypothetical protein
MKKRTTAFAILILMAIPASLALAGGAGGVGWGMQYYVPEYSNTNSGFSYITGYGYGVTWDGARIGGFGTAMIAADGSGAGGVGGLIVGHEWKGGPLTAALTLWTGVGGGGFLHSGYMLGFGEADFELGVRLLPWMQVTAYVGYQAWGNLIPGYPFSQALFYSPVAGIRIGWGAF